MPLALSILVRPDWLGVSVRLGTDQERFQLAASGAAAAVRLPEGPVLDAALRRLAAAETSATVMVNNPLYRLPETRPRAAAAPVHRHSDRVRRVRPDHGSAGDRAGRALLH
jgi:hypothetical protein